MNDAWQQWGEAPLSLSDLLLQTQRGLQQGEKVAIGGLEGGSKGFFLSLLNREISPLLVVTPDQDEAEALWQTILFFSPPEEEILLFPSEGLLYGDLPPWEIIAQRVKVLRCCAEGGRVLIVSPIQGLMRKVPSKEALTSAQIRLEVGMEVDREGLIKGLLERGYTRVEMTEERGEMSARGGIVDIFPVDQEQPVRLEFFGDQVASIRLFEVGTQRSCYRIEEVVIPPILNGGEDDLLSYLTDAHIIFDLPQEVERGGEVFWEGVRRHGKESFYTDPEVLRAKLNRGGVVELGGVSIGDTRGLTITARANAELSRRIKGEGLRALVTEAQGWLAKGWTVYLTVHQPGQGKRLVELLEELGLRGGLSEGFPLHPLKRRGEVVVVVGDLKEGFQLPHEGLAVVTEEEIFGEKRRVGKGRRVEGAPLYTFEDLREGEHVVHSDYGIGLYRGLVRLEGEGVENDYLLIEYDGGDRLYVPVDRLNLVHRYIGTGEGAPPLDRLGGDSWARTKQRVRRAIEETAKELVELYAARRHLPGFAFSPRSTYFKEFEAAFAYEETPDQAAAIEDVMRDMEAPRPADRLVCGDVGYGKTEVAIRAAFKAALDNKQVAVLAPTTVLAQQHYLTFSERLKGFPVVVECLSRFFSRSDQQEILRRLKEGRIDIIIGTHRLLRPDVSFRDLGLLIIDEEHRFGVAHKERLKEMKRSVDCFTLTATPIPRTLQMSLVGMRDLSIINTPPPHRQSIRTYLINFDQEVIKEAILAELARGGQVFFVHNRVKDIEAMASFLRGLVPEARLAIAHGQMRGRDLEGVMLSFMRGEIDLLVCTSIIESGLDIPNANTIIINHAERFGLADLYQLRGRVGRSAQRAFAYLICPPRQQLARDAIRRLRAIQELTELGSGFRLAMRDLEIRGAGNLLGHAQSGHIAEVGFELYNRMLEEAIKEAKGEEVKERVTPEISLPVEAFIPADYIPDGHQRLGLYKRLAILEQDPQIDDIEAEIKDRFGPIPPPLANLLEVIRLKVWLSDLCVKRFELKGTEVIVSFAPQGVILPERLVALIEQGGGRYRLRPDMRLVLQTDGGDWRQIVAQTRLLLEGLREGGQLPSGWGV